MTSAANEHCTDEEIREHRIIRAWDALAPSAREWLGDEPGTMLGITVRTTAGWVALDCDDLEAIGESLDRGWSTPASEMSRLESSARGETETEAGRARGWW